MMMHGLQRLFFRIRGFYSVAPEMYSRPDHCRVATPRNEYHARDAGAVATLLQCRCPADKKFDKPMAELAAKQAFFESKGYEVLINRVLVPYGPTRNHDVVAKVVDMLAMDLVDNCITTRFIGIQKLLQLLTPNMDLLLALTTSKHLGTRVTMQAYCCKDICCTLSLQTTQNLQSKVLEEGHLLYYILFAIDGGLRCLPPILARLVR